MRAGSFPTGPAELTTTRPAQFKGTPLFQVGSRGRAGTDRYHASALSSRPRPPTRTGHGQCGPVAMQLAMQPELRTDSLVEFL